MVFASLRDDEKTRFAHFSSESCKNHGHCFQPVCVKWIITNPYSRLLFWGSAKSKKTKKILSWYTLANDGVGTKKIEEFIDKTMNSLKNNAFPSKTV